jgi:hypothetical protein
MYEVTADLIQFLSNLHLFGVSFLSQLPGRLSENREPTAEKLNLAAFPPYFR